MKTLIAILMAVVIVGGLAGCANGSFRQGDGIRVLPNIECSGKMFISGQGAASVIGADIQGQIDCGDGFKIIHPTDNDNR